MSCDHGCSQNPRHIKPPTPCCSSSGCPPPCLPFPPPCIPVYPPICCCCPPPCSLPGCEPKVVTNPMFVGGVFYTGIRKISPSEVSSNRAECGSSISSSFSETLDTGTIMAVHVKCSRPYSIEALKAIMERCGGRGPSPPRCPPMGGSSNSSSCQSISYSAVNSPSSPCCPGSSKPSNPCCPSRLGNRCPPSPGCPVPCMTCPPMAPVPPCPPCPFICPPCTGYPCVTCAPFPKPVPAPYEPPRPVVRTPMNSGGLFYTGTTVCYPCLPPTSPPKCLPCTPIPGMSVSC